MAREFVSQERARARGELAVASSLTAERRTRKSVGKQTGGSFV
jgi:hypothetical protein